MKEQIEKQAIEEMAEYIFGNAIKHDTRFREDCRSIAIDLYNAGYRKQSEGEWKTEDTMLGKCCTCSVCGGCPTMEYRYCPYCGAKMKGEQQ